MSDVDLIAYVNTTAGGSTLISPLPMLDHCPLAKNWQIKSNDLADAEYTATNVTVGDQDEVGSGAEPGTACTLTASSGNGTVIANAITQASGEHATKWVIKRKTGTGVIELTLDNGSTWQDITSQLTTSFLGIVVDQAALTDPQIGIRIVTSTDAVIVDNVEVYMDTDIAYARNLPLLRTTTVAVTVAADANSLHIDNFPTDEGAIYFVWSPSYATSEVGVNEEMLSPSTVAGLAYYDGAAGNVESTDGTNTAVKAETVVADTEYEIGIIYSTADSEIRVCVDGTWGTAVTFDGAYTLGSVLSLFRGATFPARMRGLQIWDGTGMVVLKAKIDELMT